MIRNNHDRRAQPRAPLPRGTALGDRAQVGPPPLLPLLAAPAGNAPNPLDPLAALPPPADVAAVAQAPPVPLPALPAHQLARIVLLTRHRAKLAIFEFLRTNRRGALDVGYHEQIPNDGGAGYDYQVAPAPVNGAPGFVPFSHHFPRGFSKRYARELCKLAGPHGQNLDAANNDQIQGFMLMNCIARGFHDFPHGCTRDLLRLQFHAFMCSATSR